MATPQTQVPDVPLADGRTIPQLGFGVYRVDGAGAEVAVGHALDAGYRMIDTATLYGNEAGVGRAVRASGLGRDEVFVTTKLWNDDQGRDRTRAAFEASVQRLGLGAPDLYLIHWPFPGQDLYVETWRTLVELHDAGRARSVGVSNFRPEHLERVIDDSGAVPVVNQVELHPYHQQRDLRAVHAEHGIVTQAWAPLGRDLGILDDPVVVDIARAHGVGPGQVVLRWHVDLGIVAIPKSVTPSRIRANLDVAGIALSAEDHERIAHLDGTGRLGPDPERFGA